MAVIVGNYIVTSNNKSVNDYAIGLSLPLQFGTSTFNQTYENLEQLKSNIKNLLMTRRGERLGQPLFGTKLHELLFEQNDAQLEEKIYSAIENAISFWIPQVSIQSIEINTTNEAKDRNELNVAITFTANYNQQSFSVDFKVNQ